MIGVAERQRIAAHDDVEVARALDDHRNVDAELRARLGVNGQTLGTVRVRPGRLHRFYVELREILLVLAVALLGVVTVVNETPVQVALIIALVVMSTVLVVGRMRRRLSHRTKRRR